MDYKEFRSHAIQSAKLYLQYLNENNKGYSTVGVRAIEPLKQEKQFRLHLTGKIFDTSSVQIMVRELIYPHSEIEPSQYDEQSKTLDIRVNNGSFDLSTSPEGINVVSDLKFLVERVLNWYEYHAEPLQLPAHSSTIRLNPKLLTATLSDEQQAALEGIFTNPFSYIWGAPGTGKTQFVLAQAVLTYCLAQKQVLIVAPTNNAVEQTLRGILPVLKKAGIPLRCVLRFGTPSKAFFEQYPMVCEIPSIEQELEQIDQQLKFFKKAYAYFDTVAWLEETQKTVTQQKEIFEQIVTDTNNAQSTIRKLQIERKNLQNDYAPLYARIDQLTTRCASLTAFLSKKRSWLSRRFLHRRLYETEQQLTFTLQELSEYRNQQNSFLLRLETLNNKITTMNNELHNLSEQKEACYLQLEQQFRCSPVSEFGNKLVSSFTPFQGSASFSTLAVSLEQVSLDIQSRSVPYQNFTLKKAIAEENALLTRRQQIDSLSVTDRLPDTLVVATTVDGFIGRVSDFPDLKPYHVFLDEAAYCSLIKAFTLLSQPAPITFLGDHMQLPPVCEADDYLFRKNELMPMFLWSQSALYCESVFNHSFDELFSEYTNSSELESHKMARFNLLHTFRFGESLAQVLARFVYTPQFHGNSFIQTNISILNAPHRSSERNQRSSLDEAKAISAYLKQNPCNDFAVITPYKDQKKLLVQHAKGHYAPDRISTIHGSQGQEWDTVFLSVAAVSPTNFLSKQLINTAVSRAKKHLIIVCDQTCWERYPSSFLGALIASANR